MRHIIGVILAGLLLVSPARAGLVVADGLDTSNPDLSLWLRADLGVTTTGDSVTGWTDQSSHAHQFGLTNAGRMPERIASSPAANGQATVRFYVGSPTGTALDCDDAGIIQPDATVFTVFSLVCASGTYNKIWASDNSPASPRTRKELTMDARTDSSRRPIQYYSRLDSTNEYASLGSGPADPAYLSGEFALLTLTTDVTADLATLTFNGGASGTSAAFDTTSPAPLSLGGAAGSGIASYDGEIAEMIVFDRVLTADEINEVGFYLERRYGLDTAYVPEPATLGLLCLGALLALARRRQRR